ncbi:MAG: hypothetical protein QM820_40200 [Minicystis sp.]
MKAKDRERTTTIPLRKPYPELVLTLILFAACAFFFIHEANTNDRGLIINGIIHLDPGGADVFYAIMAIFSAGLTAMGLFGSVRLSAIKDFRIRIAGGSITFPAAPLYRTHEVEIPLDRVTAVETRPTGKAMTLVIHEDGAAHMVPSRWFPEGHSAREAAETIIAEVRREQAPEPTAPTAGTGKRKTPRG